MRRLALAAAALLPAACAGLPPAVDAARLPPGEFAGPDPDVAAVQYAAQAFSASSSTYGDPAAGAEAALALEYAAGALNANPRWASVDAGTKAQLLQGRAEMRAALGVAPGAPSQGVVDSLAAARRALQAGDTAKAMAALGNPAFTKPPEQEIATLGNLPYLQQANAATLRAAEAASADAPVGGPGLPVLGQGLPTGGPGPAGF